MSERLEKLFTLTDIENLDGAPVTIEAGGLIKDNKTGRVIARMYLKNCTDRPLSSVLVGFKPKGEGGRTISGMRDYLYDATGVPVGEIFGDQTGILFDNNATKSFSADVEEVDFEDGEYWDAAEAKKEAEELKLIVPEEKEQSEAPEMWEKPVEKASAPEVWESESHNSEPHSADIYGAAMVEQKLGEVDQSDFVPASMETRQLHHEERPALEEQTEAYREEQAKEVIELEGPSDEEQPVVELGGPVSAETEESKPQEPEEAPEEKAEEAPEAEPEIEAEAAPVITEETAAPETEEAAEPEVEPEPEEPEQPEEPEEPEQPEGPVRLADMYGGIAAASTLAAYASQYGKVFEKPEEPVEMPKAAETAPEVTEEAAEPAVEPEPEETEPKQPKEVEAEAFAIDDEVSELEAEVKTAPEPEAEPASTETVSEAEPEAEEHTEPVQKKPVMDIENPWAEYSSDYAPPLGAIERKRVVEPEPEITPYEEEPVVAEEAAAPVAEEALEPETPDAEEVPVPETEAPAAEEITVAEPEAVEPEQPAKAEAKETPAAEESEAPKAEELIPEEHIPTIEETIELPKAVVPEKSADDAEEILAAAAAKTEAEAAEAKAEAAEAGENAEEAAEQAEEVNPVHQKADVVFAAEDGSIPSIIEDKEKAITGEDHSGRNLLNIVVFGGIALIILLVLLIKM